MYPSVCVCMCLCVRERGRGNLPVKKARSLIILCNSQDLQLRNRYEEYEQHTFRRHRRRLKMVSLMMHLSCCNTTDNDNRNEHTFSSIDSYNRLQQFLTSRKKKKKHRRRRPPQRREIVLINEEEETSFFASCLPLTSSSSSQQNNNNEEKFSENMMMMLLLLLLLFLQIVCVRDKERLQKNYGVSTQNLR